jgi:hypothetical protein
LQQLSKEDKMNVYTIYSESHKPLYELFKSYLGDWANLYAHKAPQLCSGEYGSKNSDKFWRYSLDYFIEICEANTEPFLYLDCDVICLGDPTEDLEERLCGKDLLAQYDKRFLWRKQLCTGIMYIRPTWAIKEMLYYIRSPRKSPPFHYQAPISKYGNDQKALNRYLLFHPGKVKWGVLPKTYYSINFDNGNKVWDGKTDLRIKKRDYKMFHLNWTIGTENKLRLLNQYGWWFK